MENKLKSKAIKGVKWTSINTVFTAFSSPLFQIVLAFLLVPQEFAYIAVLSLFIGLSDLVSDLGVGEAVIQKSKVNSRQLSSLFYFNGLITIAIALIFYLLAPYIQSFYSLNNLENIIRLLIITILFNGFTSIFRAYLQKNLLFKELSLVQITKTSSDIIITILFIISGYGILGYVYGTIVSSMLYAILLVIITLKKTDLKILLHFHIKDTLPFLNFGLSISIKRILTYTSQRLDEVIIGGMLSAEILGIYYFGKRLILQLQSIITKSFTQILLPLFSRIKNNRKSLRNVYIQVSYIAALIGVPVFVGVSLTTHLFVPVFFGDQWLDTINVIRILSLAMIFQVLTANIATSMLYSVNRPNLVLLIDIIANVIYLSCLILLSHKGLIVILILYSMYTIVKAIVLQYYVSKELNYRIKDYFIQLNKIMLSTVLMSLVTIFLQMVLFTNYNEMIQLIIIVLVGISVYIGVQWTIDKVYIRKILTTLLKK